MRSLLSLFFLVGALLSVVSAEKEVELNIELPGAVFRDVLRTGNLSPEKTKQTGNPANKKDTTPFAAGTNVPDTLFVVFHAPWCGHCKALLPKVVTVARALDHDSLVLVEEGGPKLKAGDAVPVANQKPLAFVAIDCTADRDVCESFAVKGFPTIAVIRRVPWSVPGHLNAASLGVDASDLAAVSKLSSILSHNTSADSLTTSSWLVEPFLQPRTRASIESFAVSAMTAASSKPPVFRDTSAGLEHALDSQLISQGMVSFVLVRRSNDDADSLAENFKALAGVFGGSARFLEINPAEKRGDSRAESLLALGQEAHVVRLDPQLPEPEVFMQKGKESLGEWIWRHQFPVLSPFSHGILPRAAVKQQKVVAVIVGHEDSPVQKLERAESPGSHILSAAREIASEGASDFVFSFADVTSHHRLVTELDKNSDEVPFVVVLDPALSVHFFLSLNVSTVQSHDLNQTVNVMKRELDDVLAGRLVARGEGATWWGYVKRNQVIIPVATLVVLGVLMFFVFVVCYDEDDEDDEVARVQKKIK